MWRCRGKQLAGQGGTVGAGALDAHTIKLAKAVQPAQQLTEEIVEADHDLDQLIRRVRPSLLALPGVGPEAAGQLLTSAVDNPDRIRSEAAFAHLCGAAPIPASSGRTHRHRLNRGGDRNANRALYLVVLGRLRYHPAPAPTWNGEPRKAGTVRKTVEMAGLIREEPDHD